MEAGGLRRHGVRCRACAWSMGGVRAGIATANAFDLSGQGEGRLPSSGPRRRGIRLPCRGRSSEHASRCGQEGVFRLPGSLARSRWFEEHGCRGEVRCPAGFCEARLSLLARGDHQRGGGGTFVGGDGRPLFRWGGFGLASLGEAVRRRVVERAREAERHLPRCLRSSRLGCAAGCLSTEASLFTRIISAPLYRGELFSAHRQWTVGLVRQDEALRAVADAYDSAALHHAVEGIVRSLRFGSPMVSGLEAARARLA